MALIVSAITFILSIIVIIICLCRIHSIYIDYKCIDEDVKFWLMWNDIPDKIRRGKL